jgi:DNA invertase Pin-like site-specific DNA recombinase
MDNVIAYCRVSTDNQKEEGTVELQENAIKEYCKLKGLNLIRLFKDEGISGGLENRPALSELFSFLEKEKNIKAVVIWKLDRLARDLYIQEYSIKRLEALNVKLISTKEPDLDSSDPMRKAFRQFMGIVSELEKAFITMRLSGGRINKARKGGYAGGGVALGYLSKDKELNKTDLEVETVKRIFNLKKHKRFSINQIARTLNSECAKTKKGGKWYASTVSYILKNPIYKGQYGYKGIESQRNDLALN